MYLTTSLAGNREGGGSFAAVGGDSLGGSLAACDVGLAGILDGFAFGAALAGVTLGLTFATVLLGFAVAVGGGFVGFGG